MAEVRNAVPASKPYKLADSGGLYLYILPSGGKSWRF
ncbi:MAG TPA: Arm DNA-binding domain-containing protein [Sphingopyxis sp.]|nr:Arm DNA-binding domain-containing protein [Sphingopyxis sp.]